MLTDNQALARGLRLPLDALRASIESFGQDLDDGDPRAATVLGATREVERLVRRVEELMDFAAPSTPEPSACTFDEILYSVRAQIGRFGSDRLMLARDGNRFPVVTDGPLLARALRRLTENALEASEGSVLLSARAEDSELCFSIIDSGAAGFDAEWAAQPYSTRKSDHLGLGWTLAERDLALLGGTVRCTRTPLGDTWIEVRLPKKAIQEVAA